MKTELIINGSLVDLEKQETIALSKSLFDVNRLNVRTSEFSNVFDVPKTQNNRLIFKSAGIVNSFNDEPYDQLTASIKVDGVEVSAGVAELVSSDEDYYSISVQAGNGSFFKQIKALSLTDIESYLTPLDHLYNAAEVSARRDLVNYGAFTPTGLIYPNVDYGWFERAQDGDQPYNFFYPALYVHYIIESAIDSLQYKRVGSFWEQENYKALAVMAKGIVSDEDNYFVSYSIESGTDFFITRGNETFPDAYAVFSPLNFPEEEQDDDGLYVDTNLGLGYTTFGYNFPVNFTSSTTWTINLNGTVSINNIIPQLRDNYITNASVRFRLEIWNKDTDTFVSDALQLEHTFYSAQYQDIGGNTTLIPITESFTPELTINDVVNNPANLNSIGATATDHVLVWFIEILTTTATSEPVSTYDALDQIAVELEFDLEQSSGGDPSSVSVVNSFDDINIGSLFLYVNNVLGVFPVVDEGLKTIEMVSFDTIRRNKINAVDWSGKIDITDEPKVSFKLDYGKNNIFEYSNDTKDIYLNKLTNYGRGVLIVDNDNVEFEKVKYRAPFSLCAIAPTFDSTRSMGKIFTGDKYTFDGQNYNLDPEAEVEGFNTRIVSLSRSTDSPIQITGGFTVDANYEVNNTPILFDYVLRTRYSLIRDMLIKTKVVDALFNLTQVDFRNFDFAKPVFIDYLNDYFLVNEIKQFKTNEVDSTNATLIRL
jgi:hypothetical protein